MKARKKTRPGELLIIDQGAYSDYCVLGFFVVTTAFDPEEESRKFKTDSEYDQDKFLAHLLSCGYLLEVDYSTLYLGAYERKVSFRPFKA
jgi:hypothetical protein